MAFVRSVLAPKQSYTAEDRAVADIVYAAWLTVEPRCNTGRDEVLRLRREGVMLRYDGNGADAGQWLQVCFIVKPDEQSAKLAACATNITVLRDAARLIARAIHDVLQFGIPLVYFYKLDSDNGHAPKWVQVLAEIFSRLDEAFPDTFQSRELPVVHPSDEGPQIVGSRWEVRLR